MIIDVDSVTKILEETAEAEILPRFRRLGEDDVHSKGDDDLVTVADIESEMVLTDRLSALLPGSLVVGEESTAAEPRLFAHLATETPVWVVDPIDGTKNFARGEPVFAVMVALVSSGETLAAWIHDPISGETATAEIGEGAYFAGARLKVAEPAAVLDMLGTLHASSFAPKDVADQVRARRQHLNTCKSLRCAGHEYIRLARGEAHYSLFTRLMPWDHVPGTLIHREAGGTNACFDRKPYTALRYQDIGVLMAPDESSWQAVYETIFAD